MLSNSICKFEQTIRYSRVEKAGIFSKDGCKLFEKESDKNNCVVFTDDEFKRMRDKVLTHNHPSDSSFSILDITESSRAELIEIRVVGISATYSMKPGKNGWPLPNQIEEGYNEENFDQEDQSKINDMEYLFNGDKKVYSEEDMQKIRKDFLWKYVAKKFGLIYHKILWR